MVSMYNIKEYKKRYGKDYNLFKNTFKHNNNLSYSELEHIQESKYNQFITFSLSESTYYKTLYKDINLPEDLKNISKLPIVNKEMLRSNINDVYTLQKNKGIISKTGGTTGKSLEVLFTETDMQERFAMLDNFRSQFGYKLGIKTAWFSGKNLITKRDISKNRFWKTDYINKVRYYSTFHIDNKYLKFYLLNLIKYQPEFMVGFPSTMLEIAKYGLQNNISFPKNTIKAIFPTAETITPEIREVISTYFYTEIYDQYASSEGAPFIFECKNHNLHLELQSGVFEVLDESNQPTNSGRLVITSFTTHGTPLIRYDIGDEITLSKKTCNCGNNNPLVKKINGRIDDYIYSLENGKINLGNISNTLKSVYGILKFQVIQNKLETITIKIVIDKLEYHKKQQEKFLANWRDRVGNKMKINIIIVTEINNEKSGKYRMVKNNIKHLL